MFDQFLLTVNEWMMGSFGLAVLGCFLWGLVSILCSPCHIASIPLIVGYVAGQDSLVQGRKAVGYSALFSTGLFVSITTVGLICSLLGRMLGDISPFWNIPVGILFICIGLNLMGVSFFKKIFSGGHFGNVRMRGHAGALVLGLSYGILSGACSFGFIAPILSIITVQAQIAKGASLITFFALGHCLPIVVAGSSAALAQRILLAKGLQKAAEWGRKLAGGLVVLVGGYFIYMGFGI
jgi:cytochrome c-type biogenesis protein